MLSWETCTFPAMRAGERLVAAYAPTEPFIDIGSIEQYLLANRRWLGDRISWAHATAKIHAPIDGSVIGAGAEIHASCIECVVWPGARVNQPLRGAVVT